MSSGIVGELEYARIVTVATSEEFKTSAGVTRRRIVKPMSGYLSSRVLRPLSEDEASEFRAFVGVRVSFLSLVRWFVGTQGVVVCRVTDRDGVSPPQRLT